MTEYPLPWLQAMVLIPVLGALWVRTVRDPEVARRCALITCGLTLLCAGLAWVGLTTLGGNEARDRWDIGALMLGRSALEVDHLSTPLLALTALLYMLTVLSTLRTKVHHVPFGGLLLSEAVVLATFCSKEPWIIVGTLAASVIPPFVYLRGHGKPTRIFVLYMLLFVALLVTGQFLLANADAPAETHALAAALLMLAVLVRSGIPPLHGWVTDLFEHASFSTALVFVTPMVGAYAAVRLVLPVAPDWILRATAVLSIVSAVYAAGMSLVQRDARRFFCYMLLSNASLVFVGLETTNPIGLTGALWVWLSVSLSLAGFGLTLRSIECRTGELSLETFHGLYEHAPELAVLFMLTGLASVGFPGTLGFVGAELLVDGAVQVHPLIGIAIVVAAALNGLAVLHTYFRIFTGTRHSTSIDLRIRMPERIAVLILAALVLGAGLYPQPGVTSRYAVAKQLIEEREARGELPSAASTSAADRTR